MSRSGPEWILLYALMVASHYAFVRGVVVPEWHCTQRCPVAWFAVRWFRRPPYLRLFASLAALFGVSAACAVLREAALTSRSGTLSGLAAWFLIPLPWPMLREGAQVALILVVAIWIAGFFRNNRFGALGELSVTPVTVQEAASPFLVRVSLVFVAAMVACSIVSVRGPSPWIATVDAFLAAAVALFIVGLAFSFAVRGWGILTVVCAVVAAYAAYTLVVGWVLVPQIVALARLEPRELAAKAVSVPALLGLAWLHHGIYRRTRWRHTIAESA